MFTKPFRSLTAGLFSAALVLGVAACGDDDDATSDDPIEDVDTGAETDDGIVEDDATTDDPTLEDDTMEDDTMEDDSMEDDSMEDDSMDDTMEDDGAVEEEG